MRAAGTYIDYNMRSAMNMWGKREITGIRPIGVHTMERKNLGNCKYSTVFEAAHESHLQQ